MSFRVSYCLSLRRPRSPRSPPNIHRAHSGKTGTGVTGVTPLATGVTLLLATDATLVPTAFFAVTVKV